jgi:hypothetical protein
VRLIALGSDRYLKSIAFAGCAGIREGQLRQLRLGEWVLLQLEPPDCVVDRVALCRRPRRFGLLPQEVDRLKEPRIVSKKRPEREKRALMEDGNADVEEHAVALEINATRMGLSRHRQHLGHDGLDVAREALAAKRHGANQCTFHDIHVASHVIAIDRASHGWRRRRRRHGRLSLNN